MEATFREATEADLEDIVRTYNATIPSGMVTADTEPVTVASRQTWLRAHLDGDHPIWIVLHEGKYAGWLSFSPFYGRPAYRGTAEVSVYIDEAFRGKGLGRASLAMAIGNAPDLGVSTLLGFIFAHNAPSLALFTDMGFSRWALLPGVAVMRGLERDLVIMGRKV